MSSLWASLSATKLQQQLSDVAKELVASEESERPIGDQVSSRPENLTINDDELAEDSTLQSQDLFNGAGASTSAPPFVQLPETSHIDSVRMRREVEQAQAEAKRLRSYLLETQTESEQEILNLQRQLDALISVQAENSVLKSALIHAQQDLAASLQREEAARSALRSIEQILSNVQSDQEQEISIRTLHLSRQLDESQLKLQSYESQISELKLRESEYLAQKQQALQLQIQVDKSAAALRALQQENVSLKATLDQRVAKLSAQADASEVMIDKRIIRNLLTSYFNPNSSAASKSEVLDIMSRMVSMTNEERSLIGVGKVREQRGWLSSLGFGSNPNPNPDEQSLSNLWVQYLAAATGDESTPSAVASSTTDIVTSDASGT